MKLIRPWATQSGPVDRFVKGEGAFLWDQSGRRYFDLCSQMMAVNLGHANPIIGQAIADQMAQCGHINPSYSLPIRERMEVALSKIAPAGLSRALLTTGGAEAIENAIKIARLATGRHKIITKYRSYHGATAAAITASGDPRRFSQASVETPGIVRVEDPYCFRCPWGQTLGSCTLQCASHLERVIEFEGPHTIAAIILEGESGTSGCIKYPPGYWRRARTLADKYGIVLIADEVMSGFRSGEWFAVTRHGVTPDMVVMAKGLTSGYVPMGGVLIKESLISPRYDSEVLPVGLTYAAHPAGCAAAVASIQLYTENDLIFRPAALENQVAEALVQRLGTIPCVGDIRLTGLLGVIELVVPGTSDPLELRSGPEKGWTQRITQLLWEVGIVPLLRWNYIFFAPPINTPWNELETAIDQLGSVLDRVSIEM